MGLAADVGAGAANGRKTGKIIHSQEEELTNDYLIRLKAADSGISLITNIQLAQRFVEALSEERVAELQIESRQEYELRERAQVRVLSTRDDGARPGGPS